MSSIVAFRAEKAAIRAGSVSERHFWKMLKIAPIGMMRPLKVALLAVGGIILADIEDKLQKTR